MPALRVWAYRVWDYVAMCKCRDYLVFSYSVGFTDYFFLFLLSSQKRIERGTKMTTALKMISSAMTDRVRFSGLHVLFLDGILYSLLFSLIGEVNTKDVTKDFLT